MTREDWEWEDIAYWNARAEIDERIAKEEKYECELCGSLHSDDTKIYWNDEHNTWCCESCEDVIEEYLETKEEQNEKHMD